MDLEIFNKVLKMKKRKILLGCACCDRRDFCPMDNKSVECIYDPDYGYQLTCLDLLELYETFQEIGKRIKEKQEKDKK